MQFSYTEIMAQIIVFFKPLTKQVFEMIGMFWVSLAMNLPWNVAMCNVAVLVGF